MNDRPYRWGIFLAHLDPTKGSEQRGTRPVLVVSNELVNRNLGTITVLPITSMKAGRHIYPNEVMLKKGTAGLTVDSVLLGHQIRAIAKERLGKVLGYVDDSALRSKVERAIFIQLDF